MTTPRTSTASRTFRAAGIAAILFGIVGMTADTLMLYAPGFSLDRYAAVCSIPAGRMQAGFYLGILFIPLYVIGYWLVYRAIKPAGQTRAGGLLFIGVYGSALGTIFHAVAGMAVMVILRQADCVAGIAGALGPEQTLLPYMPLLLPLFILVHLILVVGSVWFAVAIWPGGTPFRRWTILLSPGVLSALFFLLSVVSAPLGDFLQPAALNIAHTIFFASATVILWNHPWE